MQPNCSSSWWPCSNGPCPSRPASPTRRSNCVNDAFESNPWLMQPLFPGSSADTHVDTPNNNFASSINQHPIYPCASPTPQLQPQPQPQPVPVQCYWNENQPRRNMEMDSMCYKPQPNLNNQQFNSLYGTAQPTFCACRQGMNANRPGMPRPRNDGISYDWVEVPISVPNHQRAKITIPIIEEHAYF